MLLQDVIKLLNAQVLTGTELLERRVCDCYGSDMMSEVLAYCNSNSLICTGLTNRQVVRTAYMTELAAIVFVCNKRPCAAIIEEAEENGLPLLVTELTIQEACTVLQGAGLKSCRKGA